MSHFRTLQGMISTFCRRNPKVTGGLVVAAGVVTLVAVQYRALQSCKTRNAELQRRLASEISENFELEQENNALRSKITEKDESITALKLNKTERTALAFRMAVRYQSTRQRLALALALVDMAKDRFVALQDQYNALRSECFEEISEMEKSRDRFKASANMFSALLEENKRTREQIDSVRAGPSSIRLGDLKKHFPNSFFQAPANWKEISTTETPLSLPATIELYKAVLRLRKLPSGDREFSEGYIMAMAGFWLAKKAIPKEWLSLEIPMELANQFNPAKKPQRSFKGKGPAVHTNGVDSHTSDECVHTVGDVLVGTKRVGLSEKAAGKLKATVAPPPLVPKSAPIPFTGVMAEQAQLAVEAKEREKALTDAGIVKEIKIRDLPPHFVGTSKAEIKNMIENGDRGVAEA